MLLEISRPDKNIFQGEVSLVQLPGLDGSFEILNNHAPMISILAEGKIKIKKDSGQQEEFFDIKGGVLEVKKNKVVILAE